MVRFVKPSFHLAIIVAAVFTLIGAPAGAAERVALVIGNGNYGHAPPLPNPPRDATDIAGKLEQLGFRVTLGTDLTMADFRHTLRDFVRTLEGADVALFFYAGHGLQVDGRNYIVPVDAELRERTDLEFDAVAMDDILATLDERVTTSIVLLDACRDNPLTRSLARSMGTRAAAVGSGLASQSVASGSYIAFATAPGHVAYDGADQPNSPFTTALLKHVDRPNVDIRLIMADVRADVFEATRQKQLPWENNSLIGRFYLNEAPEQVLAPAVAGDPGDEAVLAEAEEWTGIRDSDQASDYEAFLVRYPEGLFADVARARLLEIAGGQEVAVAAVAGDPLVAEREPAEPATRRQGAPGETTEPKAEPLSLEEAYWRTIRDSTEIRDFEGYLRNHPDSRFRDLAEARIAALGRAGEIADFVSDGEVVDRARLRAAAMERIERLPKQFLQYGLIALGFPVADVTGVLDAATRRAVRQYQASIGEPQTGRPTAQQTVDLLFAAATVGDAHAETGIGIMVASGYGLTQDYELARMWLGRASSQGNEYAKANLAVLYRDGLGGEKNLDLARSLLSDAYESGLDEAGELLADFPG